MPVISGVKIYCKKLKHFPETIEVFKSTHNPAILLYSQFIKAYFHLTDSTQVQKSILKTVQLNQNF